MWKKLTNKVKIILVTIGSILLLILTAVFGSEIYRRWQKNLLLKKQGYKSSGQQVTHKSGSKIPIPKDDIAGIGHVEPAEPESLKIDVEPVEVEKIPEPEPELTTGVQGYPETPAAPRPESALDKLKKRKKGASPALVEKPKISALDILKKKKEKNNATHNSTQMPEKEKPNTDEKLPAKKKTTIAVEAVENKKEQPSALDEMRRRKKL